MCGCELDAPLPILRTAEFDVSFSRRLFSLVEHQVHSVERHRKAAEEVEDVLSRHPEGEGGTTEEGARLG